MEYDFIEAIRLYYYFNLGFKESCLKAIFPGVNYITHDTVKKFHQESRGELIVPKGLSRKHSLSCNTTLSTTSIFVNAFLFCNKCKLYCLYTHKL